ncbi:MAG: tRNA lysidine(34) synthetase TilS [Desulfuromonadaceae bacterium]|nr:tRNA lysidine(34) synthetase TilS [Desulfuromonadaceae bacterium]MDD2854727.1 tRNA lysidine(34) synthetase TilS [Desulfuromonadaceae bacterium]
MSNFSYSLLQRLMQTVQQNRLFNPGDTLIVGISGGADSTALLDMLVNLTGYNLTIIAAHLNHSLRDSESDADEEFCRELATGYKVLFEVRRVDLKDIANSRGLNLEDAGRGERIRFLDEMRIRYSAASVLLAHHRDDQAETVLMRLLRGSGMTGLSGMAYRNERGYLRPLLDISREEIERYLLQSSLKWREDSSNSDTIYLRNRIRHELLPILETYNPAIRSRLSLTAEIIKRDNELLEDLTDQTFKKLFKVEGGRAICGISDITKLNTALQLRVLRQAVKEITGTLAEITHSHINAVFDLIYSSRPNSKISLPNNTIAVREYEHLFLTQSEEVKYDDSILKLTAPGIYKLPVGGSITVNLLDSRDITATGSSVCLDLQKLPFPWHIRTFMPGDRMTMLGMKGRKKVKDIFIDRKVPLSERRRIPLLFCGEDLVWIAGICVSELSRFDTSPETIVRVVWSQ